MTSLEALPTPALLDLRDALVAQLGTAVDEGHRNALLALITDIADAINAKS